jgi:hypothetical protein
MVLNIIVQIHRARIYWFWIVLLYFIDAFDDNDWLAHHEIVDLLLGHLHLHGLLFHRLIVGYYLVEVSVIKILHFLE